MKIENFRKLILSWTIRVPNSKCREKIAEIDIFLKKASRWKDQDMMWMKDQSIQCKLLLLEQSGQIENTIIERQKLIEDMAHRIKILNQCISDQLALNSILLSNSGRETEAFDCIIKSTTYLSASGNVSGLVAEAMSLFIKT